MTPTRPGAQAQSVLGLLDELGVEDATFAGYDIGSAVAQSIARAAPERVHALVLSPPLPGAGDRVRAPGSLTEAWYQTLHGLPLAAELIDGDPRAVRAYLRHFWTHWSGPSFAPQDALLDHLVDVYSPPGAFTASIAWYRAPGQTFATSPGERTPDPAKRTAAPTSVLWPEHDPIFPLAWSDRLDDFFSDVTLERLEGVGHFTPLEAPDALAAAIERRLAP